MELGYLSAVGSALLLASIVVAFSENAPFRIRTYCFVCVYSVFQHACVSVNIGARTIRAAAAAVADTCPQDWRRRRRANGGPRAAKRFGRRQRARHGGQFGRRQRTWHSCRFGRRQRPRHGGRGGSCWSAGAVRARAHVGIVFPGLAARVAPSLIGVAGVCASTLSAPARPAVALHLQVDFWLGKVERLNLRAKKLEASNSPLHPACRHHENDARMARFNAVHAPSIGGQRKRVTRTRDETAYGRAADRRKKSTRTWIVSLNIISENKAPAVGIQVLSHLQSSGGGGPISIYRYGKRSKWGIK